MCLLVVVWTSYRYGRRTGIIASVLSVLCFDFFLVPPYLTFRVSDTEYFITFIGMLIVSLFISTITGRLGSQTKATRGRETRLRALYQLSRTLAEIPEPHAMLQAAWQQLHDFYKVPLLLLTNDGSGRLKVSAGDAQQFGFSGNDVQAAEWVFRNSELAGRGTDTLAGSNGTYIPLRGREKTVGVLGIRLEEDSDLIEPEQLRLLETFAVVIGGALESKELSEAIGKATASMEAERLRNLVLRSFAFDLAAPSQEIAAAAKQLAAATPGQEKYERILHTIIEKAQQINKVTSRLPQYVEESLPSHTATASKKEASNNSLSRYLAIDRIQFIEGNTPGNDVIKSLIRTLNLPNPEEALRLLAERDEIGGILIKPNVTIPHTSIAGITGVHAALGIQQTENGHFFWLLFVSGADSIQDHLEFLKSAALTLSDDLLEHLGRAETPEKVMRILASA